MIHIVVCDDDIRVVEQVERLILDLQNSISNKIEVTTFYSGARFSKAIQNGCPFDIIFMDIEMEGIDGIKAGHLLRADEDNDWVQLIYISGHEQYHVQLFDVQPSGFIKKPIQPELFKHKLLSTVKKAIRRRQLGTRSFLPVQQKGREVLVPFRDIIYLESRVRKVKLHTRMDQIEYYSTLNEEESKLPSSNFIRIHQSYIVNFYFIREISYKNVSLVTGLELPISGKYSASVKKNYLKFRGSLIE
ncbi:LytR/AlgR family response regulator transcription factor [Paenibacillus ihumii]|uniref:LytR/AlgR family response regulator transcription factor n=1 Tax=Paenibacillus ihumii TaxID=687436 RepID=UPI0006D8607A|nr:LytTR family DNA-binding domain-containing protein [Paenibacillus ihumii]